jgi:hypothetical protein
VATILLVSVVALPVAAGTVNVFAGMVDKVGSAKTDIAGNSHAAATTAIQLL